jgi:hypothetical protein
MVAIRCWVSALLLAVGCTVSEVNPAAELEGSTATPSDEPPVPGCVPWIQCNTAPTWSAVTCDPLSNGDECEGLDASCRPDGLCGGAPPASGELCPHDDDDDGLCRSTNGVVNLLMFWQDDAVKP